MAAALFGVVLPARWESQLLTVAQDLAPWLEGFKPEKNGETAIKVRYLDRSVDLEYTHEDDGMYLSAALSF